MFIIEAEHQAAEAAKQAAQQAFQAAQNAAQAAAASRFFKMEIFSYKNNSYDFKNDFPERIFGSACRGTGF